MSRLITFGEIMMRLNPEGYLRFVQADKFEVSYAGGEANVPFPSPITVRMRLLLRRCRPMRSARRRSMNCAALGLIQV